MATRVMVFIDYWNFQLRLNEIEARRLGQPNFRFKIDWRAIGPLLARKACEAVQIADPVFEGCNVYTSYNPSTEEGKKFRQWATTWLGRQPGVTVECRERKP
jgi:hypothetical protein